MTAAHRVTGSTHSTSGRAASQRSAPGSDPADARTQRVWLLPAGQEQLPTLRKALGRINERLVGDFTPAELEHVLRLAAQLKHDPRHYDGALHGRTVACIFEKPSTASIRPSAASAGIMTSVTSRT